MNRPIDVATAQAIASTRIDAVIAPSVDDAAAPILAKKTNMRVVIADFSAASDLRVEARSILGAILLQERDVVGEAAAPWSSGKLPDGFSVPTKRQPTDAEWRALRFAWRICAHVKSNTIIFTDATRTLAIGAGQMSRVDAANVTVMKARRQKCRSPDPSARRTRSSRSATASTSSRTQAQAVIQPGGSVKDAEVIARLTNTASRWSSRDGGTSATSLRNLDDEEGPFGGRRTLANVEGDGRLHPRRVGADGASIRRDSSASNAVATLRQMNKNDERLVTLAEFDTRFEAGLARGALEAIGIRVFVPEEHMFRASHANPGRLQVFEHDRERAMMQLRRLQIRLVEPGEIDS